MAFNDGILNNLEGTVNKLKDAINPSIRESFEQNKNIVLDYQREQLFSGTTAKSNSIRPFPYAKSTINYKRKKGQPTDRITLKDSGNYYLTFDLLIGNNSTLIFNTKQSYSVYLIERYADILGLTEENKSLFVQNYTLPIIKKNFDDIIAES